LSRHSGLGPGPRGAAHPVIQSQGLAGRWPRILLSHWRDERTRGPARRGLSFHDPRYRCTKALVAFSRTDVGPVLFRVQVHRAQSPSPPPPEHPSHLRRLLARWRTRYPKPRRCPVMFLQWLCVCRQVQHPPPTVLSYAGAGSPRNSTTQSTIRPLSWGRDLSEASRLPPALRGNSPRRNMGSGPPRITRSLAGPPERTARGGSGVSNTCSSDTPGRRGDAVSHASSCLWHNAARCTYCRWPVSD